MARCGTGRPQHFPAGHQRRDSLGGGVGDVDDGDARPEHVGDRAGQQRIVGAAEHCSVDTDPAQLEQVFFRDQARDFAVGPPVFGERYDATPPGIRCG